MEEKSVGTILAIIIIWLAITVHNQDGTIGHLKQTIVNCATTIEDANSNIDDLNNQITDAQSEAWSDYETMGSTLENLRSGDEVDGFDCTAQDN
jgi:uncharacterized coiled-coil protein SlyX